MVNLLSDVSNDVKKKLAEAYQTLNEESFEKIVNTINALNTVMTVDTKYVTVTKDGMFETYPVSDYKVDPRFAVFTSPCEVRFENDKFWKNLAIKQGKSEALTVTPAEFSDYQDVFFNSMKMERPSNRVSVSELCKPVLVSGALTCWTYEPESDNESESGKNLSIYGDVRANRLPVIMSKEFKAVIDTDYTLAARKYSFWKTDFVSKIVNSFIVEKKLNPKYENRSKEAKVDKKAETSTQVDKQ